MEYVEYTGKTLDDAITNACQSLVVTSERLDYVVIEKGKTSIFGFASKPAVIKARVKSEESIKAEKETEKIVKEIVKKTVHTENEVKDNHDSADLNVDPKEFLSKVFKAMDLEVEINVNYKKEENEIEIDLSGKEMGVLIGKRGQTLDSLQYLTSLVVNKGNSNYIRVKIDTENYRKRRRETLENLAKNLAYKVKRTKRPVALEPMNPYERRVIHSTLQNDKYVSTHSEGEEPFRRVIITLNK